MAKIGPSFASEIEAAGLAGLPFSWGADGVTYGEALSGADRTRVAALVAAHDPNRTAPPVGPTAKADIWRRATDAEAEVIMAGLDGLPLRKRQIYDEATYLDRSDPMFSELLAGFVQAFGTARAAALLAPSV